jgi:3-oxoacyl-[acyl-carrier-protein] synthase II
LPAHRRISTEMVNPDRRVVVTGMGVIAPNGVTLSSFWDSVVAGRSSAAWVTRFDAAEMPCRFACEIKRFDSAPYLDPKKARRFDPAIVYAIAAGKQAMADAGFEASRVNPSRFGIVEGTSVSGLHNTLREHTKFIERGYRSIQPTALVNAFCGGASSEMAIEMNLQCQAVTITTACSAGNDAIGYGLRTIQDDLADVMIAGASEAPIVDGYYAMFAAAGVMSRRKEDPGAAMRPFDQDRDGFILGEGAAFLVLEELSHALARDARIYCEVVGHGQACDAYSIVNLDPEGKGTIAAIKRALRQAELNPDQIDYINCHGSATQSNDVIETKVIKSVFGARAAKIPLSATKPVTGHLAGAAAAVEAVICATALTHNVVPPTANLDNPAAGCDLDYVPHTARNYRLNTALSLSAGFGGKHSALILKAFSG